MADRQATGYTLLFATAICIVCGILVSSFAVSLEDLQDDNIALDKQKRVLEAVGLLQPGEPIDEAEVAERFEPIEPVLIELGSGEPVDGDTATFDQQRRARDPATSAEAPDNLARVKRIPDRALLYEVRGDGGELEMVVLPIEGLGLWGTLYGFWRSTPTRQPCGASPTTSTRRRRAWAARWTTRAGRTGGPAAAPSTRTARFAWP